MEIEHIHFKKILKVFLAVWVLLALGCSSPNNTQKRNKSNKESIKSKNSSVLANGDENFIDESSGSEAVPSNEEPNPDKNLENGNGKEFSTIRVGNPRPNPDEEDALQQQPYDQMKEETEIVDQPDEDQKSTNQILDTLTSEENVIRKADEDDEKVSFNLYLKPESNEGFSSYLLEPAKVVLYFAEDCLSSQSGSDTISFADSEKQLQKTMDKKIDLYGEESNVRYLSNFQIEKGMHLIGIRLYFDSSKAGLSTDNALQSNVIVIADKDDVGFYKDSKKLCYQVEEIDSGEVEAGFL